MLEKTFSITETDHKIESVPKHLPSLVLIQEHSTPAPVSCRSFAYTPSPSSVSPFSSISPPPFFSYPSSTVSSLPSSSSSAFFSHSSASPPPQSFFQSQSCQGRVSSFQNPQIADHVNVQFIWIPQNDIIDYKSFSVCEGDQKNRHEYASLFARILAIRRTVFVDELHVAVDSEVGTEDSRAHHLLLTVDGTDVGCSRVYQGEGEDDVEEDSADDLTRARARVFRIGRLAILSRYRGNGYAKLVMVEMERKIKEELGGARIVGSARFHLLDYYRKLGYFDKGEAYTERNTKLIMIEKTL